LLAAEAINGARIGAARPADGHDDLNRRRPSGQSPQNMDVRLEGLQEKSLKIYDYFDSYVTKDQELNTWYIAVRKFAS
jgi:hypothetical protein